MATAKPAANAEPLSLVTLLALCTMAPLLGYAGPGIAPIMPMISAEFAGTPHAEVLVRMMMSGLGAATILGSVVTGLVATRIGTTRLLLMLLALFTVSGAGIFLLDNLYLIVAARVLQGIAVGGAGVLALALLTTRIPAERRDRWLGFYAVSGAVGILALIMATGVIAEFGWRTAFLLFLLTVPVAFLIASTVREGRGDPSANAAAISDHSGPSKIPWGMTLFGALCGSLIGSIGMYLPYHLASVGHGAPETVAVLMVVGSAMGAAAGLSFGWVRGRLSAIPTFIVGFVLIAVGLVALVMSDTMVTMSLAMATHGCGLGMISPNLISACAAATPTDSRARMLGFVRGGLFAGPLVVQPGLEAVTSRAGATGALVAIAGISVFAIVVTLVFRRVFDPVE